MNLYFSALQPTEFERRRALCGAICEVLWQAGSQTRCCVCLQQELPLFDTDYTYRVDGVTEKVRERSNMLLKSESTFSFNVFWTLVTLRQDVFFRTIKLLHGIGAVQLLKNLLCWWWHTWMFWLLNHCIDFYQFYHQ